MIKLKQVWTYMSKNKYWVVTAAFVLIIGVFDENSLLRRVSHWYEIRTLNSKIEYYRRQYEENSRQLKELTSNPEELEKIAREKYRMKKENEDIYIFEDDLGQ